MPAKKYQLYVWDGFDPGYDTPYGLAVAIARSEQEAKEKIEEKLEYYITNWGSLSIHPLNKPVAFAVSGENWP